ncbi:MAG TPA: ribbon-helix-helix domain-containing protein [Dongiaceae bacterium]|nr:ribbon-helix-helix domain-containing protein [Dongiaceae bacterium]
MCQVFASQDATIYKTVTRSVRLNGFCTSIRLEALFWSVLDQIAAQEGMSTPRFISTLYDEVMELRGEVGNFTSLLRVTCASYIEKHHSQQPVTIAKQGLAAAPLPLSPRASQEQLAPV